LTAYQLAQNKDLAFGELTLTVHIGAVIYFFIDSQQDALRAELNINKCCTLEDLLFNFKKKVAR